MGIPILPTPITEVLNGDFNEVGAWTVDNFWSIAGGTATYTGLGPWPGPNFGLFQTIAFQEEHLYRFRFEILNINVTPGNGATASLFLNYSPVWDTPGIKTWYVAGEGPETQQGNLELVPNKAWGPGETFEVDNVSVIDISQVLMITYGLNPADINLMHFYHLHDGVYQFIISQFNTPTSFWIEVDADLMLA